MTEHQKDLAIPCPAKQCRAANGRACKGLPRGIVHFGRRLLRLLEGIR